MNQKKTPYRITVALDDDSVALLRDLENDTKLSPGAILAKLFPAHLEELWAYRDWLKSRPAAGGAADHRATHLLHSYGPGSLIADIKAIDPTFRTQRERFNDTLKEGRE